MSKFLGLSTEASQRFERGADINITTFAVDRAASMIQEFTGAEVCQGRIDIYTRKYVPKIIPLRVERLNNILGTDLKKREIVSILRKIDIQPKLGNQNRDGIKFITPSFRPDLVEEIDLIEEVARYYGYHNIPIKKRTSIYLSNKNIQNDSQKFLREWFVGRGFSEIVTNSLVDAKSATLLDRFLVQISNPISREMGFLRTSLVPSMLRTIQYNIAHGTSDLNLFEIGKVYWRKGENVVGVDISDYLEQDMLIFAKTGYSTPIRWDSERRFSDIFSIKGEIELIFKRSSLDNYKFIPYSNSKPLFKYGMYIEINGKNAGYFGSVSNELLESFGVEQQVFLCELVVNEIPLPIFGQVSFKELPKYPFVTRDLAIIVDEIVPVEEILHEIRLSGYPLLQSVELFDLYRAKHIGENKKSCAFTLIFQSDEKTLLQEEVDDIIKQIVRALFDKFTAILRT